MTVGISVIVCCYNSELYLPKTIESIALQKTGAALKWELIVVDNNSSDRTGDVALEEWSKYPTNNKLRIVQESRMGLNYARSKGFEVAEYEYCLFCDDDNWLDENYLGRAFEVMATDPSIGVLGGRGVEVCEVEPPPWFDTLKGGYAVGKQGEETGDITMTRGFVYGAGSIFRKSVYLDLQRKGFKHLLADRKGNVLSSGGDKEMCYAYRLAGYKIFYIHENVFGHFISKKKLTKDYVFRMYLGFSSAQPILTLYEYALDDYNNKRAVRDASFIWIKDVLYTFFLLLAAIKLGHWRFRMRFEVLIGLLRLPWSYRLNFIQISSLRGDKK
jgi:glycosyltransferase involved in cell wall biosynthesis